MAKVILDAGHGGYDNGAGYLGRNEKDDNLEITLALGEELENRGIEVFYTRTEDMYDSPIQKAAKANEQGGDLFVSIHRNSSPTPNTYSGVQTLIYDESGIKPQLAENINESLEAVGYNNLGVSLRPNLAVLRRTNMPAALVEVGFINTDADNTLLDSRFAETVQAIADGIIKTLGEEAPSPQPSNDIYSVQVGLFGNYSYAQRLADELKLLGFTVTIEPYGNFYAVLVGEEDNMEAGTQLLRELQQLGYDTLLRNRTGN